MNIILGSSSPRRERILKGIFDGIRILVPDIEEIILENETPLRHAERVSMEKAEKINSMITDGLLPALTITCDTIVTIDGMIIGKPSGFEDGMRILGLLNGRTHNVISGITMTAIFSETKGGGPHRLIKSLTGSDTSGVTFRKLTAGGIEGYLNSIDYSDKAGS
jgi:septum formation protein